MYIRLFESFRRNLPRNVGIVINNLFCAVLATVCGPEDHSSFSAVLGVVQAAFELGVDRKITQHSRAVRGGVS